MLRVTSSPLHAPPMLQYHRNSSTTVRPRQPSPRQPSPSASDGVGNPGVKSVNELLSPPAQSQPTEPKTQPIWITSDTPPPPRPPRRSRRRPQTAPSLSSFDTQNDPHGLLPIILQFPDSPKHPSEIDEQRPTSLPPTTLPHSSINNTGFLNRVPKRIQFDDDSASTSASNLTRRPSVPALKSYIRSPTPETSNLSEQLARNKLLRREPSLMSMDANRPVAELRSRAKSTVAFSEAVLARRKDHRSADTNPDDKKPTVSPVSFSGLRTASEMSHSPPVTASTLSNESMSSLTVYESPQEEETGMRQGGPRAEKKPLWDITEAKVHFNSPDKKTLTEPQPSHLITFQCLDSTLQLGSPSKPGVGPEVIVEQDENTQTGMVGGKATPRRTGGTMRRVWRSIIGRK